MKILMTGMSARSVGSTKIRYDFIALSDIFHVALEDLGHEVVRRVVSTDESDTLDEFDKALVLVNWVSSLSSMHVHEAGLAMSRLGNERTILYVDDWRTESLGDDIEHHVSRDHGWANHTSRFRKDYYDRLTADQTDRIREQYLRLIDPAVPTFDMIGPFHPWGDPQRHLDVSKTPLNVKLLPIDPSPAVILPDGVTRLTKGRPRAWVLATLQNHDRWLKKLDMSWPLVQLGGVKKKGGGINPGGPDKVVPEAKVVTTYGHNWGMLVAPYKNAGSGWWRPRYTYALDQGAVVFVGAEEDRELIGPSFTNELADIESATEAELVALQRRQSEQFHGHEYSYAEFLDRLDHHINGRTFEE